MGTPFSQLSISLVRSAETGALQALIGDAEDEISDEGAARLADALGSNNTLTTLYLNRIGITIKRCNNIGIEFGRRECNRRCGSGSNCGCVGEECFAQNPPSLSYGLAFTDCIERRA